MFANMEVTALSFCLAIRGHVFFDLVLMSSYFILIFLVYGGRVDRYAAQWRQGSTVEARWTEA